MGAFVVATLLLVFAFLSYQSRKHQERSEALRIRRLREAEDREYFLRRQAERRRELDANMAAKAGKPARPLKARHQISSFQTSPSRKGTATLQPSSGTTTVVTDRSDDSVIPALLAVAALASLTDDTVSIPPIESGGGGDFGGGGASGTWDSSPSSSDSSSYSSDSSSSSDYSSSSSD